MRDDTGPYGVTITVASVTASALVAEVVAFRAIVADPDLPAETKACAWDSIVRHASMLDVNEPGFERAGVALKEALCLWLDARPARWHAPNVGGRDSDRGRFSRVPG